jgi:hypothetical protein
VKIKRSVLTRLHTGTGVSIGGFNVPLYALTRSARGSVAITGQATYRVRREFANGNDGHGVLIP